MRFLKAFKEAAKAALFCCPPIRALTVFIYKQRGQKPWSFGYSLYKYAYIRQVIEQKLDMFNAPLLPDGYGARLDERCVEYPWFFSRLKDNARRILDAGSSLNHYDLLNLKVWQGRQLHITTLADEGKPPALIKPVYVYQDLRAMRYPNEFFDAVVCISTLEHVGMDNALLYTDDPRKKENDAQSHVQAVDEMRRVLKEEGTLYLTMPYGRRQNFGWFQVFDEHMVASVVKRFMPRKVEMTYYKYDRRQWNTAGQKDCAQGYYVDIHAGAHYNNDSPAASQCVVCLSLTK